ncbi:hypothetical protein L873DRAFT_1847856 [Choiromyces venosus 120613-1]|uniref:Uncharacterized protein n=1 Tax=Choiromyces venosus 120613-1 TaxID=1336337 RepID=A0A3N4J563_9PEZI|nr:hypothetical protein L873DRAFT_1847856 [Choiromyces venosus 120613-1]
MVGIGRCKRQSRLAGQLGGRPTKQFDPVFEEELLSLEQEVTDEPDVLEVPVKLLELDVSPSGTGRGGRPPCRQIIWRRKKQAELQEIARESQLGEYLEPEGAGVAELEWERAERGEMMEEEEEIRNGGVEISDMEEMEVEDVGRMVEEVLVPGWEGEMEQQEEEENDERDNLAEAVKSWPVLSKYQSTRFKHRILTKGISTQTLKIEIANQYPRNSRYV